MRKTVQALLLLLGLSFETIIPAHAQTYLFTVEKEVVELYWNSDGKFTVEYTFDFENNFTADPLDYVDIGMPSSDYSLGAVQAEINGTPIHDIQYSEYVTPGIALGLGSEAIQPGEKGTVHFRATGVGIGLFQDDADNTYVSFGFSPTWFGREYVTGTTDLTFTLHPPPGLQNDQPRYHIPQGWPGENDPAISLDDNGQILYTWQSDRANSYTQYIFGASIPQSVIPAGMIQQPSFWERTGINPEDLIPFGICGGIAGIFALIFILFTADYNKRRLQYLPPSISIEGHGIKRGITAVEAGVVMGLPMDKLFTMILFSVIKKGAAKVKSTEPLELDVTQPISEGLMSYEKDFLQGFLEPSLTRKKSLRDTMVKLVREVAEKMRGFSQKETVVYYEQILKEAWEQIDKAGTPEMKSQLYEDNLQWTMLDKDFDDRTRQTFRRGAAFAPIWWSHYDPGFSFEARPGTSQAATLYGSHTSAVSLPGADFAASLVRGVQGFAASAIGDVAAFTSDITDRTNPIPVTVSRSGGGSSSSSGHSCACACACAGCACACAGGGR